MTSLISFASAEATFDSYEEPATLMVAGKTIILGNTYQKAIKKLLTFMRVA